MQTWGSDSSQPVFYNPRQPGSSISHASDNSPTLVKAEADDGHAVFPAPEPALAPLAAAQGGGAGLADGSAQASFPFIFPSWALDSAMGDDSGGFMSMLNPVMGGTHGAGGGGGGYVP